MENVKPDIMPSLRDVNASLDANRTIYDNVTSSQWPSVNVTLDVSESTTPCLNDYCVSNDEYRDMIVAYIKPTLLECFLIVAYVIVLCVGLAGNFLVCFAVWRNHSMRTVTNYFIGKSTTRAATLPLRY